jgi:hypothetical protein
VRYRLMATYQGSPFEAGIGPTEGDIVLFAACPPPEELGFEPATGHWRKQLRVGEVQAVWESRPVGTFRGERCMVLDDLGDRLHIGYLGHDGFKAEQLGYWQVDRGVFELVAPRTEVTDILEERTEKSRPGGASNPAADDYALPRSPGASGQYSTLTQPATPRASGQYPTLTQPATPRASGQYPTPVTPRASGQYPTPVTPRASGRFSAPTAFGLPGPDADGSRQASAAHLPVPDSTTGVALPVTTQAPLPLEAEAMRAATAARRPRPAPRRVAAPIPPVTPTAAVPAATGLAATGLAATGPADTGLAATGPADTGPAATPPSTARGAALASPTLPPLAANSPAAPLAAAVAANPPAPTAAPARQRRAARRRMATERLFADLAALAGIPADSYAVGEIVDGALCLVQTEQGFEVFHSAAGARHELQVFATEESACFYLFGLLAAEAVRNGSLAPVFVPAGLSGGHPETA